MPGYLLKSHPRSPRRAWKFALLGDDGNDRPKRTVEERNSAVDKNDENTEKEQCTHEEFPEQVIFYTANRSQACSSEIANNIAVGMRTEATSPCSTGSSSSSYEEKKYNNNIATKKMNNRQSAYPILAPLTPPNSSSNHNTPFLSPTTVIDHDHNLEVFSIHVEMAKSAFLRNPCRENWMDLVHNLRIQSLQQPQLNDHVEDGNDGVMIEGDNENVDSTENRDMSWANFEEMHRYDTNDAGWTGRGARGALEPFNDKFGKLSNKDEEWEETNNTNICFALARLESSLTSLEEKASHIFHHDVDESLWGSRDDDREERDVSPSSVTGKEDRSSCTAYDDSKREACTSVSAPAPTSVTKATILEPDNSKENAYYVLDKIQHWETQIVQHIAGAALDQAQNTWKDGQIVEIVPSSPVGGSSDGCDEGDSEEAVFYVV